METPNYTIINALAKGDDEVKKMILEVLIEEFPLEKESYFNYFNLKDFKNFVKVSLFNSYSIICNRKFVE